MRRSVVLSLPLQLVFLGSINSLCLIALAELLVVSLTTMLLLVGINTLEHLMFEA